MKGIVLNHWLNIPRSSKCLYANSCLVSSTISLSHKSIRASSKVWVDALDSKLSYFCTLKCNLCLRVQKYGSCFVMRLRSSMATLGKCKKALAVWCCHSVINLFFEVLSVLDELQYVLQVNVLVCGSIQSRWCWTVQWISTACPDPSDRVR